MAGIAWGPGLSLARPHSALLMLQLRGRLQGAGLPAPRGHRLPSLWGVAPCTVPSALGSERVSRALTWSATRFETSVGYISEPPSPSASWTRSPAAREGTLTAKREAGLGVQRCPRAGGTHQKGLGLCRAPGLAVWEPTGPLTLSGPTLGVRALPAGDRSPRGSHPDEGGAWGRGLPAPGLLLFSTFKGMASASCQPRVGKDQTE